MGMDVFKKKRCFFIISYHKLPPYPSQEVIDEYMGRHLAQAVEPFLGDEVPEIPEEEEADAREAYEDFKKWLEAETIPPAQPNPSLEWPAKSQKPDVAVKSEPASSAASAFFEAAPESEKPCPVCKKDKVDCTLVDLYTRFYIVILYECEDGYITRKTLKS